MSRTTRLGIIIAAGIVALAWTGASPAGAQGYGPGMMGGPGSGPGMMYGPGYGRGGGGYGYGRGMMGYGPGMMGGCMGFAPDGAQSTFVDGRIAFLKAELAITDSQKSVWDAYAEAIKRNLQSVQGMWQVMKTVFEAKTPVERLDAHTAAMEARLKALKDIKPALTNLYAALSAEQKKKADEIITGMGCMM